MRSRAGYWLGGLLIIAGIAVAAAFATVRVLDWIDDIEAWPSTTGGPVRLEQREYVVFAEDTSVVRVAIRGPDGRPVPLDPTTASYEYDVPGRSGVSIGEVDIPAAGDYAVTADPAVTIRFGEGDFVADILVTIVIALGIAAAGALAGIVLLAVTARRRRGAAAQKRWP